MTCDYALSTFDWETSAGRNDLACTVLPNQLLQLLRPFVPVSHRFDESFAKTFAIPEFRTLSSGSAQVASRLLGLLTAYEGIAEETAVAMLANDILLDKLRKSPDPAQAARLVESELAAMQADLLEEKQALKAELEAEKQVRAAALEASAAQVRDLALQIDSLTNQTQLLQEEDLVRRRKHEDTLLRIESEAKEKVKAAEVKARRTEA